MTPNWVIVKLHLPRDGMPPSLYSGRGKRKSDCVKFAILALTAMKTSSPPHCYLNMATLNRRRPRAPKAKPKEAGPVAYVGRLRHLLDAQLTLEDALETAEDDNEKFHGWRASSLAQAA